MSVSCGASVISSTILFYYHGRGLDAEPLGEERQDAEPLGEARPLRAEEPLGEARPPRAFDQQKEGACEARGTGGQIYVLGGDDGLIWRANVA